VALDAVQFHQVSVVARGPDAVGELVLLVDREQDICLRSDDERTLQFQPPEAGLERTAVLGENRSEARDRYR
jgi:hypothetical protein